MCCAYPYENPTILFRGNQNHYTKSFEANFNASHVSFPLIRPKYKAGIPPRTQESRLESRLCTNDWAHYMSTGLIFQPLQCFPPMWTPKCDPRGRNTVLSPDWFNITWFLGPRLQGSEMLTSNLSLRCLWTARIKAVKEAEDIFEYLEDGWGWEQTAPGLPIIQKAA